MTFNQVRKLLLILAFNACAIVYGAKLEWDPAVVHGKLSNGLNYYVYDSENSSDPFNLRLIVHAGSIDEPEVKGIAHAVEHMVFNQTTAHPDSIHNYLSHIGWQTGRQVNAVTQPSETHYMIRTRPNDSLDLKASLALLADIAGGAQFTDEDWEREQKIIWQEKRQGDRAVSRLNEKIKQATKPNSKYAEGSVIGTYQSIGAITLDDLKSFYQRFYVASNMTLIISGYINDDELQQHIVDTFGSLPKAEKPKRDYLHYPLKKQIHIAKVQDPEGTTSKVALGLRIAIPGKNDPDSTKIRLEQYFIRKLLAQVRRDFDYAPETVESLTGVLKEPTAERLTLAFASRTTQHDDGLKTILTEMERLSRYGFYEDDFKQVLSNAREVVDRNTLIARKRNFASWEDKIVEAVLDNSFLAEPELKAKQTHQLLDNITFERINQRLKEMLNAEDIFIYYQAPGSVQLKLPSVKWVKELQQSIRNSELEKPIVNQETKSEPSDPKKPIQLAVKKPTAISKIQEKKVFDQLSVIQWSLVNGYRVVWLQQATPDNKVYFKAVTETGDNIAEYPQWLVSAALQLHEQSPPPGIDEDDWIQWKSEQKTYWSLKLNSHNLDLSVAVEKDRLENAFYAFWLNHQPRDFSADALDAAKESAYQLIEQDSDDSLDKLKFSHASFDIPEQKAVDNLKAQSIQDAALKMILQPKTLFIVGEADPDLLETLSVQYLATIPAVEAFTPEVNLLRAGQNSFRRQREGSSQTQVTQFGRTPMEWRPEQAFMLSTINPIAQKALKQKLRLEMAGVYTVRFEANLNPNSNQAETELSFTTSPEQATVLLEAANKVLSDLTPTIEALDFDRLKADIHFAEENRLKSSSTWLRRLMLSYKKYNDPRYLESMKQIAEQIDKETLIKLSKQIFPLQHQVQIFTEYRPGIANLASESND